MDTKKLRQKILDLAIHGKLVPQDPNDEPASVLLERIRAEKERLIKEGKIKRSRKTAKTSDTPHYPQDVPFEVPEGWVWTTLGEIGTWQSGATPSRLRKDYYGGNIPWLKTGDLNDGLITDIPEFITQKAFIAMGGGGAQPNISKEKIAVTFMPLPPLTEQQRIVVEIERWFKLIDAIDQSKADLQTTITQTKSKILDLAIHGKLVPQDPSDEPASELLKRINPKAQITCDNEHYPQLPKGWIELKIGMAATYTNGRAFKPEEWMQEGLPIIRIQNLNDNTSHYNRTTKTYEARFLVKNSDLLFAWAASLGTYIWEGGNAWLNQHIFKVEPYSFVNKKFLYYAFKAMVIEFYRNSHGSGMVHITKNQFENINLLLPPLEEQKRIVNKIEELFAALDTIEQSLQA